MCKSTLSELSHITVIKLMESLFEEASMFNRQSIRLRHRRACWNEVEFQLFHFCAQDNSQLFIVNDQNTSVKPIMRIFRSQANYTNTRWTLDLSKHIKCWVNKMKTRIHVSRGNVITMGSFAVLDLFYLHLSGERLALPDHMIYIPRVLEKAMHHEVSKE